MSLTPHPRYEDLLKWFAGVRTLRAIDGVFFRVAGPAHTTAPEIVAGVGAFKVGGRWNPPKHMNAVYASVNAVTALQEALAHCDYYGIPHATGMPKVVVALSVKASRIVDLTDPADCGSMPVPIATLLMEDWRQLMERGSEATAQAMGRAAFDAGIQGLLVPSKAIAGSSNLVLFPTLLNADDLLEVCEPHLLEALGKPGYT